MRTFFRFVAFSLCAFLVAVIVAMAMAMSIPASQPSRYERLESRVSALELRVQYPAVPEAVAEAVDRIEPAPESPEPGIEADEMPEVAQTPQVKYPVAGDRVVVHEDVAGGAYLAAGGVWDDFMAVCSMKSGKAQDAALVSLEQNGKIALEQNGAILRVDRVGVFSFEATVVKGDHVGFSGWIPREYVRLEGSQNRPRP